MKATPGREWAKELDDRWFLHTKHSTHGPEFEYPEVGEEVKAFIRALLTTIREEMEKEREIHTHNSIPNYTDCLEEGCIKCWRNQQIWECSQIIEKYLHE